MRKIKALIIKEFYQIIRDPSSMLISFFLPLLLLFIYGVGVSLDANKIRLGVAIQDNSPLAQSFVQSLKDSRYFEVTLAVEPKQLYEKMIEGRLRGVVVIPSYFTQFYEQGVRRAPIEVIADGSEPNTANFVQNYVLGAYFNWQSIEKIDKKMGILPQVRLDLRVWYNEELKSRNFLVPGSLAITMTLVGTLLTALVIAREWERGTMESLISTPVTIWQILIAKLIPYFILGMGSMGLSVFCATMIYDIPLRGSILMLALVSAIFLIPALGLGLLISTTARYQVVASQIATVTGFLPAFILSGFIFEIGSMPYILQIMANLIPAKYFVTCLQTLFLVGNVWKLIFMNLWPILIIGVFFFLITATRVVKRLD